MKNILFGWLAIALSASAADGQHDFDFNVGVWKTQIKRVMDPFAASKESIEINGTVSVRKIWDGRALLEEIEAEGPKGHWQALSLFLYNPQAHQWSQTFINSKTGVVNSTLIGSFKDGRGELFSRDTFAGRSILVRGIWSDIEADSHKYEEDYSDDGGKTWAPAFLATLTRELQPPADPSARSETPVSHEFDFDLGRWKTRSWRLLHPLTGSKESVRMEGVTVVQPIWGGRANIAELEADLPKGHLQLLSLRLYDPRAHQWSLNFATSGVGVLNYNSDAGGSIVPMIGEFRNGRGVFYDQESYEGHTIWVRFIMTPLSATTARSEQAFSKDGGKTWETNWINEYTRIVTPRG